ncbi:Putative BSD domain-containing protein [Septoria linicola]|uniref:BSD domain-containing protein n=1 Tax=Septoria linicola TaxID=215465 RepID=A0A9Q9EGH9_9PEZI|nr:putative BSD domain-containing protein [Septoria linicola]USW48288.1 Putative BSD domain-containing protein [Septoria linicola]
MDVAYDHIQEEALSPAERKKAEDAASASASASASSNAADSTEQQPGSTLNTEFQQAFQAVSASPWGAKLGGWFSQAKKQSETFYQDLSKEAAEASEQATKGFSSLRDQVAQRTRGMSDLQISRGDVDGPIPGQEEIPGVVQTQKKDDEQAEAGVAKDGETAKEGEKVPESLPADIVKEAASLVTIFRSTAAQKLKDLQKAEDAADEALVRYGTNLRNYLRDAVTISAPDEDSKSTSEVLFSTEDAGTGKKVFHTTRLDAQLHAIHASAVSFTEEPQGVEWESWRAGFDADSKTDAIAKDLEKYEELRRAMEKLVPEKVGYRDFWMRYYYLRKAVEAEEARRKEVLKGATADTEEEVKWDDDDDDDNDNDRSITPNANAGANKQAGASTTTLNANAEKPKDDSLLSPTDARRSEDGNKSVADSDASYDLVSGATSRAPGSPKEQTKKDDEESDDDWE